MGQQIITVIAVLVGAVSSYLLTSRQAQSAWARERAAAWDDRRVTAYVDYGRAVKMGTQALLRVAISRQLHDGAEADPEDSWAALARSYNQRAEAWESVLLLGSPSAVDAARAWHFTLFQLDTITRDEATNRDSWQDKFKELGEARDSFYAQARRDLGIASDLGAPPRTPALRSKISGQDTR